MRYIYIAKHRDTINATIQSVGFVQLAEARGYFVNYIRLNPEFFSEWHQSVIALRFAVQRTRESVRAAGVQK